MKKLARTGMKKPAKKLTVERDTIQSLAAELQQVIGGHRPCTENKTGCTSVAG